MIALRCAPPGAPATEVLLDVDTTRDLDGMLARLGEGRARFALIDTRVDALHTAALRGLQPRVTVSGGETAKTFSVLEDVLRALAHAEVDRDTFLVVVGGGSVGDLGGLAASLYARGLDFVLAPTTLLAMVDSSVGGKTAIDLPEGKNLVGTFHPARLVLLDLTFLRTLPEIEFRSGLGELLKVALGLSAELFALLEANADAVLARDHHTLVQCVRLALDAKIALVESDFHERGARRLLNLGHSLGHALEAHSGYTLPHGIAVARGLHFALRVAAQNNHVAVADVARARQLLARYAFQEDPLPPTDQLLPFLRRDKKVRGDGIHFVVPTGIGASTTVFLSWPVLATTLGPA